MRISHLWGDALLNSKLLTDLQNKILSKFYDGKVSDTSYTQVQKEEFNETKRSSKEDVISNIEAESSIF